MRILVSGASGLIGSALVRRLTQADGPSGAAPGPHAVVRLVRSEPRPDGSEIRWDPGTGQLSAASLDGFDAVVHLAGENIAGRWTADKKARIRQSRVQGTSLLCHKLAQTASPPRVLVSASAVGYYGDRGDQELDESSPAGSGFLPEVCRQWEEATQPAAAAGIRVVNARFGMVLAARGGALARMLPLFRFGLGGRLGSGRQYLSWIALDDAVEAIRFLIVTPTLRGPVNLTAPQPVTNREFTKALGRLLRRPTLLPAPAFALRLAFGEMANAMLLCSARVRPRQLLESNFEFRNPMIEQALQRALACWPTNSGDRAGPLA